MAITKFADMVIVPEHFTTYVNERTTEKSALVQSGVATPDARVAQVINGTPLGGNMVVMPFYKPLSGDDEVFGEDALTPDGVQPGNERATLLIRQKSWGTTDLARVKGGSDPMAAIMGMVSDWWLEREQAVFISVLKGLFGASGALATKHLLDISTQSGADAVIGVDATLDAKNLMGDAYDKITAVAMHSATYTKLQKQQKIETEYSSDLKVKIDTYLGYRVIVDDSLPVNSGVYDTYLIGAGAFTRDSGAPSGLISTETDRDKLKAEDFLINRKAFVLHPNGVSFTGNPTKAYATNDDLATASNWQLVKDAKNVPIVCLRHKI
jgi:coat protein|nr:MAG TPA: major capsid protein [Caudoviricetes sp.]